VFFLTAENMRYIQTYSMPFWKCLVVDTFKPFIGEQVSTEILPDWEGFSYSLCLENSKIDGIKISMVYLHSGAKNLLQNIFVLHQCVWRSLE